jgi:hypothetical protein
MGRLSIYVWHRMKAQRMRKECAKEVMAQGDR